MILVFFVNIKHPLLQRDIMVKMHWKTLQKSFQSYESSNLRQYGLMDCKRCFVLILQPSSSAFIPLLAVPVISMLGFFHVCSFLYGCFCFFNAHFIVALKFLPICTAEASSSSEAPKCKFSQWLSTYCLLVSKILPPLISEIQRDNLRQKLRVFRTMDRSAVF